MRLVEDFGYRDPQALLSGFMFPFDALPEAVQKIGSVLPLTHYLRIVRQLMLKGASLASLGDEIAATSAFFAAALVVAATTRAALASSGSLTLEAWRSSV